MSHASRAVLAIAGLAIAFATGCNPPQGNDSRRVSTSTTTEAEAKSVKIPLTSLVESSDKISQDLARDVTRIANEVGKGYRAVVVFGNLENKTQGVVNTTDFEIVRDRLKSKLVQSSFFRDNVKFVASRAALEELKRREIGQSRDLLQEGGGSSTQQLNPEYTLFLNGSLAGSFRGKDVNYYYMHFSLVRASDGEEVFNSDYEIKRD